MVSVTASNSESLDNLVAGLSNEDVQRVLAALEFVAPHYDGKELVTEQDALQFSRGVAVTLSALRSDADTRIAGLLFELPQLDPNVAAGIEPRFGKEIVDLVGGVRSLM